MDLTIGGGQTASLVIAIIGVLVTGVGMGMVLSGLSSNNFGLNLAGGLLVAAGALVLVAATALLIVLQQL